MSSQLSLHVEIHTRKCMYTKLRLMCVFIHKDIFPSTLSFSAFVPALLNSRFTRRIYELHRCQSNQRCMSVWPVFVGVHPLIFILSSSWRRIGVKGVWKGILAMAGTLPARLNVPGTCHKYNCCVWVRAQLVSPSFSNCTGEDHSPTCLIPSYLTTGYMICRSAHSCALLANALFAWK